MSELTDLQKENDKLWAKLDKYNKLSVILTNLEVYGEDGQAQGAYMPNDMISQFDNLRYETESQSLSDIKAEAVREFWDTVMGAIDNNYLDQWGELTLSDFDDVVNDHANKLNN